MFIVKISDNTEWLNQIIDLRYLVLRQPWNQPKTTATDEYEWNSINAFIEDNGKVIACGRLQNNSETDGQIRYMAVHPDYQGKGLGKLIVQKLEQEAARLHLNKIELHARENALEFYKSQGYILINPSYVLWNIIPHYLMEKNLK